MKSRLALPLLLLGLMAALPTRAQAQEIRFETAEEQLAEIFEEFGFEDAEMYEDTDAVKSYEMTHNGLLFNISVFSDQRVVLYAFWLNGDGLRRSTLIFTNDWNDNSWTSKVVIADDGRYLLISTPPVEMELTVDSLVDVLDTFLLDLHRFDEAYSAL